VIFYIFPSDLLRESDSNIFRLHVSSCFQIVAMLPLLDLIFHELVAGTLTARAMLACQATDGQVDKARLP